MSFDLCRGFLGAIGALQAQNYGPIIDLCGDELAGVDSKWREETYFLRATFRFLWGYGDEVLDDLHEVTESKTAGRELRSGAWIKKGLRYSLANDDIGYAQSFKKAQDIWPENVDIYHQVNILSSKTTFIEV
jgi:hypothetical protein